MSESFVVEYLAKVSKSDGVALDIGAHHGKYTTDLAQIFKHVYAFEPHPENLIQLRKRIKTKAHPNITVIEKAIAIESGKGKLYTARSNKGGHSIARIVAEKEKWGHKVSEFLDVEFISLDDFIEQNSVAMEKLEFIKMDIEGAEAFVFQGATKTLQDFKLDIMLETHQTYEMHPLYEFFTDAGYTWYNSKMDEIATIKHDNHYLISNSDRELVW